jgi:hypothetical protein
MDSDSAIIEAAFTLGKHAGGCNLTPEGARMFSRLLDLTVRAGMANDPEAWESPKSGRAFVLGAIEQLATSAARAAKPGNDLTPEILRQATNQVVDEQRRKLGIPRPSPSEIVLSKFCFAYLLCELFDWPEKS